MRGEVGRLTNGADALWRPFAGGSFGVVDFLCEVAHRQDIHFLWRPSLPEPQDEFVLELAVAANCEAIITHNVRDFVGAKRFKPKVLTPSAFLARIWKAL